MSSLNNFAPCECSSDIDCRHPAMYYLETEPYLLHCQRRKLSILYRIHQIHLFFFSEKLSRAVHNLFALQQKKCIKVLWTHKNSLNDFTLLPSRLSFTWYCQCSRLSAVRVTRPSAIDGGSFWKIAEDYRRNSYRLLQAVSKVQDAGYSVRFQSFHWDVSLGLNLYIINSYAAKNVSRIYPAWHCTKRDVSDAKNCQRSVAPPAAEPVAMLVPRFFHCFLTSGTTCKRLSNFSYRNIIKVNDKPL